jgi:hypothetical protein
MTWKFEKNSQTFVFSLSLSHQDDRFWQIRLLHPSWPPPTFPKLNNLVSVAACDTTCSLRVSGQLNYDLCEHMIPLPLSPLLYDCSAPLVACGSSSTVPWLFTSWPCNILTQRVMMRAANPRHGIYLTCACTFGGRIYKAIWPWNGGPRT